MKILEIDFALLSKKNKLIISIPTSSEINKIGRSIVYIDIRVNIWLEKNNKIKVNIQYS